MQFLITCVAGLLVASAGMPSSAGDYEDGLGFHEKRSYAQSLELFRRAAEQGDAWAQFALAYMYGAGQGVPQDYLEEHKWAALAEANGNEGAATFRMLIEKRMPPELIAQALVHANQQSGKPTPAPSPPRKVVAQEEETKPAAAPFDMAVSAALETWRAAWARRDANAYLAAYAPDFKTPDGMARPKWEAQRRERMQRATQISVRVSDPFVQSAPDGSVTVRFTQVYKSGSFREIVNKSLVFARYGGRWLIRAEIIAPP